MNVIKKNSLVRISLVLFILLSFISCKNTLVQTPEKMGYLSISANVTEARTVMPDISFDDLELKFVLFYSVEGQEISNSLSWSSVDLQPAYSVMKEDTSISLDPAVYNFILYVMKDDITILTGKITGWEISAGEVNVLNFEMLPYTYRTSILDDEGNIVLLSKGSLDMTLFYPENTGVKLIKYSFEPVSADQEGEPYMSSARLPICKNIEVNKEYVTLALKGIPQGQYIVKFSFYNDINAETPINVYSELVTISSGCTSSAQRELEGLNTPYYISYILNEGTYSGTYSPVYTFNQYMSVTLPVADNMSITSYTFEGWYEDAAFTGEKVTEIPVGTKEEKIFYAKWIPKECTIFFNANDGTGSMADQSVPCFVPTEINENKFERTGYEFVGWESVSTGSSAVETDTITYLDKEKCVLSEDRVFYAKWRSTNSITIDMATVDLDSISTEITNLGSDICTVIITGAYEGGVFTNILGVLSSFSIQLDLSNLTGLTEIPEKAFEKLENLISIKLPTCVTTIGDSAFSGCTYLFSVDLSNVTTIGASAFSDCYSLSSIDLSKVTTIGDFAFFNCYSLSSVDLSNIETIGEDSFKGVGLSELKIGSTIKSIGDYAFLSCSKLESIEIGDTLSEDDPEVSMGENVFNNCIILTSAKLGTKVTKIGNSMFYQCGSLNTVNMTDSVTEIGSSAFEYCSSLSNIELSNNLTTIGDNVFGNCYCLESIEIPGTVESIGSYVFYECSVLESVTIPGSVTSLGSCVFNNCSKLKELVIPDSVTINYYVDQNGENCFIPIINNCENLEKVTIGSGISGISEFEFLECPNLKEIIVSSENKSLLSENGILFSKDKSALIHYPAGKEDPTYEIPTYVNVIYPNAFNRCDYLREISFADTEAKWTAGTLEQWTNLVYGGDASLVVSFFIDNTNYVYKYNYLITYDANGGSGSMADQIIPMYTDATALTSNSFTKDGCTFAGWATSEGATEAEYTEGQEIKPTENITLYAVWTVN